MAFCPRCAAPNLDSAIACASCGAMLSGSVGTPTPQAPPPTAGAPPPFQPYAPFGPTGPRTNGLAIGGFVCGLSGILCGLVAIAGLIMSIIAYRQCKDSHGDLKGEGFAIAGIILSIVWLLLTVLIIFAAQ
jgi:hypothetical protein